MQHFAATKHLGPRYARRQTTKEKQNKYLKTYFKKKLWKSRVNEGHCDVAGAVGGGQAFMQVSQSPRVHKAPAFPG